MSEPVPVMVDKKLLEDTRALLIGARDEIIRLAVRVKELERERDRAEGGLTDIPDNIMEEVAAGVLPGDESVGTIFTDAQQPPPVAPSGSTEEVAAEAGRYAATALNASLSYLAVNGEEKCPTCGRRRAFAEAYFTDPVGTCPDPFHSGSTSMARTAGEPTGPREKERNA